MTGGQWTSDEAARRIFQHVEDSGLWPAPWGPPRPEKRNPGGYHLALLLRTGQWAMRGAPEIVRKHFSRGASLPVVARVVADDWVDEARVSLGNAARHLRDYVFMKNEDYRTAAQRSLAMEPAPEKASGESPQAKGTSSAASADRPTG